MTYQFVATCLFGLEHFLGEEIDALGYKRIESLDGRVIFEGDESAFARANLWLRTAERLFLLVGTTPARSFAELFDGVNGMPWDAFIGKEDAFPVSGHSIKSTLTSIPDCQSIIKKSIAKKLGDVYSLSWLPETGTTLSVEFFILKDRAMLMIDLSGTALHKRGYRPQSVPAPLRETLAAALVTMARPREDVLFWDPFCGSATIPIEAAMKMTDTAPGLNRGFAAEAFSFLPSTIWKSAREEARDRQKKDVVFEAFASDIDPEVLKTAQACVKASGMENHISVFRQDALTIETGGRRGTVVCNPPYGERLSTLTETEKLYRAMGKHFATLDAWQIYVLTSNDQFEKLYGRKADKKRKLYNGMIPCGFYQFYKKEKKD